MRAVYSVTFTVVSAYASNDSLTSATSVTTLLRAQRFACKRLVLILYSCYNDCLTVSTYKSNPKTRNRVHRIRLLKNSLSGIHAQVCCETIVCHRHSSKAKLLLTNVHKCCWQFRYLAGWVLMILLAQVRRSLEQQWNVKAIRYCNRESNELDNF